MSKWLSETVSNVKAYNYKANKKRLPTSVKKRLSTFC